MAKTVAITIILFSLFVTIPLVDATCTTTKTWNYSFTNCRNGVSSFGVTSGGTTFYQFNDGSTGFTSSFGNTSFSSGNRPNLRGTSSSNGETGVSQWNNNITGVHQRTGNLEWDNYSDGTTCTTYTAGVTSLTNCNGKSKDAAQRSTIIGTK